MRLLAPALSVVLALTPAFPAQTRERSRPEITTRASANEISWDIFTKSEGYLGSATLRHDNGISSLTLEAPDSPPATLYSGPFGITIEYAGQTITWEEGRTIFDDAHLARLATAALEQKDEILGQTMAADAATNMFEEEWGIYEIDMGFESPGELQYNCTSKTNWCIFLIAFDLFSIYLIAGACAAAAVTGVMGYACYSAIVGHVYAGVNMISSCNDAHNACKKWTSWQKANPGY